MAQLSKRVVVVAGWDNRQPIAADVASQIELALSNGVYVARAVTVTPLVRATMTQPNAGSNQIIIEMLIPSTVLDSTLIAYVTDAVLGLVLPTAPSITVGSVTLF